MLGSLLKIQNWQNQESNPSRSLPFCHTSLMRFLCACESGEVYLKCRFSCRCEMGKRVGIPSKLRAMRPLLFTELYFVSIHSCGVKSGNFLFWWIPVGLYLETQVLRQTPCADSAVPRSVPRSMPQRLRWVHQILPFWVPVTVC